MLTIKNDSGAAVDITTLKSGKLKCIADHVDYNFFAGKKYKIHYSVSDGNKGPYIFGTKTGFLGIFGDSDTNWLVELPQDLLDKFILI